MERYGSIFVKEERWKDKTWTAAEDRQTGNSYSWNFWGIDTSWLIDNKIHVMSLCKWWHFLNFRERRVEFYHVWSRDTARNQGLVGEGPWQNWRSLIKPKGREWRRQRAWREFKLSEWQYLIDEKMNWESVARPERPGAGWVVRGSMTPSHQWRVFYFFCYEFLVDSTLATRRIGEQKFSCLQFVSSSHSFQ